MIQQKQPKNIGASKRGKVAPLLVDCVQCDNSAPSDKSISLNGKSRRWAVRRKFSLAAVAIVLLVILGVWLGRDEPPVRLSLLKGIEALYWVYDPSTPEGLVPTGPTSEMADRLTKSAPLNATQTLPWKHETTTLTVVWPDRDIGQGKNPVPPESPTLPHKIKFDSENLASPLLDPLRNLGKEFVEQSENEFDLCNNLRSTTIHGQDFREDIYSKPDEFLSLAKKGKRLTCRHFSIAYVGLASLKGYTSRVLGLSQTGDRFNHAVVEIYSPDLGKWVMIDPDFNITYRHKGVPLSAAELHDAWTELKRQSQLKTGVTDAQQTLSWLAANKAAIPGLTGIEVVPLGRVGEDLRRTNLEWGSDTGMGLEWYEYVFYRCRNDYLTGYYPFAHPRRVRQFVLQEDIAAGPPRVCPEALVINDRREVYWPVGRVIVSLPSIDHDDSAEAIVLQLSTYTPNFQSFEVSENGAAWSTHNLPSYEWKLRPGKHELRFRTANLGGVRGEVTTVRADIVKREQSTGSESANR